MNKREMKFDKNQYYHIYNRGNNSQRIFYNRGNYFYFIQKMKKNLGPYVSFVAWCFMPNHFHLIVQVNEEKIPVQTKSGLQKERTLNEAIGIWLRAYTRALQKQEKFTGSLFQQHTKAKLIIDEVTLDSAYWDTAFETEVRFSSRKSYLDNCIEYVYRNPVAAGLVKCADDWEFSFADRSHAIASSDSMTQRTAIIGIGSNINAEENIVKMLELLKQFVTVEGVSGLVKTKPIGIDNQPEFTNGAVKITTSRSRQELKSLLKKIEDDLGRDRSAPKFGPRTMDLDIVIWDGEIVDDDYHTRDFVRKSVDELA